MTIKKIVLILICIAMSGMLLTVYSLGELGLFSGLMSTEEPFDLERFIAENAHDSKTHNDSITASIKGIKAIHIISNNTPINIVRTDSDTLTAELNGRYKASGSYTPPAIDLLEGDELLTIDIIYTKTTFMFYSIDNIELTVYLPKDYAYDLQVTSSSGDVAIQSFELSKLNISTTSGSQVIENIQGAATLEATSGEITVKQGAVTESIQITATSGDVHFTSIAGSHYNLDLSCTSGTIDVGMPILTTQGANNSDALIAQVGNGGAMLNISTTSGDIKIQE